MLTAYAAARLTPIDDAAEDAGRLVASMLTAGLERDALRWTELVDEGFDPLPAFEPVAPKDEDTLVLSI